MTARSALLLVGYLLLALVVLFPPFAAFGGTEFQFIGSAGKIFVWAWVLEIAFTCGLIGVIYWVTGDTSAS